MGWFRKRRDTEAGEVDAHPAPITIDLGFQQHPWQVEALVTRLEAEGRRVHLDTQSQVPELGGGLGPKRCLVLVAAADEGPVREELVVAGFL